VDRLSTSRRSENMRRIRSTNTSPELCVRGLVHRLGYRFRLHRKDLPGKPDLVFPRLKKVVLVHGCFWHQHLGCIDSHVPKSRIGYWAPKLQRNCERDAENSRMLLSQGWRVLIIWECETRDAAGLEATLTRFLGDE
jgi:DNA mismatch endonuclease (patch repair protein)